MDMNAYNNLEDMIKVGIINEIDLKKNLYRVKFEQDDDVKSYWFQPIYPSTNKDKTYFQYSLGEQVLVLTLYEGNQDGYIIGSMYSEEDTPPRFKEGIRYIEFEDGSCIQYDKNNKSLTVNAPECELVLNVKSLKIQADDIQTIGKKLQNTAEEVSIMSNDCVINADSTMLTGDNISLIASEDIVQNSNEHVMQYEDYGVLAKTTDIVSDTGINLSAKTNINAVAPTSFAITSPSTTASGTLGVTGATTLGSTLGVTGDTTLSSKLGVTGDTTLSSKLGVTGETTLSSKLGVTGETTLSSNLDVKGLSTLEGNADISNIRFTDHNHGYVSPDGLRWTVGIQ
ncbi:phage baseplate assembly protein V [bacterium]|nr:phage baseplate assembly protein V [bacterium]